MTQPYNPNPYADPRGYGHIGQGQAAGQLAAVQGQDFQDPTAGGFATTLNPGGSFRNPIAANAYNAQSPMPYGGYAGGFADTRNQLLAQQAAAGSQKAPTANFGQAQGYMGQVAGSLHGEGQAIAGLQGQANTLRGIAGGAQTAADTSFNQGMASSAAAQQSAAGAAAPGAAFSAAGRDAAANQGYAAQQGVGQKAQLDYNQRMAAQQQLAGVNQQIATGLQGERGLAQGRVQGAQGMAEFNPGMQEGQNALNAETQSGYNTGLLGMQQAAQQAGMQSNVNANNYYLGQRGLSVAQQGLAIGAAGGAIGAGVAQLGGAFSSGGGAPVSPGYGGYMNSPGGSPVAVAMPGQGNGGPSGGW
jgi:hypothetical protein